jgi:small subunit ribosomal protein S5
MDAVGVNNVLSKLLNSSNPFNVVRATFAALDDLESVEQVASRRGIAVDDLYHNYTVRWGAAPA